MASPVGGSASAQHAGLCKGLPDMEDEDDLFEIDLDSVDSIPQTQYYWDSYFTETGNALLANCLLPVTDISRAIPMVSKALSSSEQTGDVAMIPQAVPLGQLLGLPFLEAFGLHQKEMKRMCDPIRKTGAHLDVGPEPLEGRGPRPSIEDGRGQSALERAMELGAITDKEFFILLSEHE